MLDYNINDILSEAVETKLKVPQSIDLNYENFLIEFGSKLYDFRKKHKMTQQDLGSILNINQEMVSRYESAQEDITVKKFFDIVKMIGLNFEIKLVNKKTYTLSLTSGNYWCRKGNDISSYEMFIKEFAVHIKHFRDSKKLTQAEFSTLLSETQTMVSKYESGKYNITFKKMFKILKVIDSKIFYKQNHNEFFDFIFSENNTIQFRKKNKIKENSDIHFNYRILTKRIKGSKNHQYRNLSPEIFSMIYKAGKVRR